MRGSCQTGESPILKGLATDLPGAIQGISCEQSGIILDALKNHRDSDARPTLYASVPSVLPRTGKHDLVRRQDRKHQPIWIAVSRRLPIEVTDRRRIETGAQSGDGRDPDRSASVFLIAVGAIKWKGGREAPALSHLQTR